MMLLLWIENVFSHVLGVCHIVLSFGLILKALPFPLLFLYVVPFVTYLGDDEDIGILVEIASCFCKSDLMVL